MTHLPVFFLLKWVIYTHFWVQRTPFNTFSVISCKNCPWTWIWHQCAKHLRSACHKFSILLTLFKRTNSLVITKFNLDHQLIRWVIFSSFWDQIRIKGLQLYRNKVTYWWKCIMNVEKWLFDHKMSKSGSFTCFSMKRSHFCSHLRPFNISR